MSDFLAVAGVSAVLKSILDNALNGSNLSTTLGVTPVVSALAPDRIVVGDAEVPQINLFLYHVNTNPAWRNNDLPWHDSQGQRVSNAPLPLTLHYFLSTYGKGEFDSEILLGWAMQILHETPILTRTLMQETLNDLAHPGGGGSVSSEVSAIGATTLPQQVELVRITPEVLTMDDLSKLWTAFQARYRTTAAYQASVVLIQSTTPVRAALPVQTRNILVQPWQPPIVENIPVNMVATGEALVVEGRNFLGDSPGETNIMFDGAAGVSPDILQNGVAKLGIPTSLFAGVHSVQVARNVDFGIPTDPHSGFQSNAATFMLVPTITGTIPATVQAGTSLTLAITPAVGRDQRATVLIGGLSIDIGSRPLTDPLSSATLVFPIPADFPVSTSAQPLRVRIDGAQSRLTQDGNPASPTYGQFLPQIQVTAP
jgi:hypothetical protein